MEHRLAPCGRGAGGRGHLSAGPAPADEMAAAIVFLASPAAAFITSFALPVDGGHLSSLRKVRLVAGRGPVKPWPYRDVRGNCGRLLASFKQEPVGGPIDWLWSSVRLSPAGFWQAAADRLTLKCRWRAPPHPLLCYLGGSFGANPFTKSAQMSLATMPLVSASTPSISS